MGEASTVANFDEHGSMFEEKVNLKLLLLGEEGNLAAQGNKTCGRRGGHQCGAWG